MLKSSDNSREEIRPIDAFVGGETLRFKDSPYSYNLRQVDRNPGITTYHFLRSNASASLLMPDPLHPPEPQRIDVYHLEAKQDKTPQMVIEFTPEVAREELISLTRWLLEMGEVPDKITLLMDTALRFCDTPPETISRGPFHVLPLNLRDANLEDYLFEKLTMEQSELPLIFPIRMHENLPGLEELLPGLRALKKIKTEDPRVVHGYPIDLHHEINSRLKRASEDSKRQKTPRSILERAQLQGKTDKEDHPDAILKAFRKGLIEALYQKKPGYQKIISVEQARWLDLDEKRHATNPASQSSRKTH
ncbi:MAG: hypothetical protein ACD_28C00411G0002 [uncultured bacterium]|nr:MAG: hypothetical protein ACD_28C00411G0002 [uncultured bacterium]